jgi:hypothetical protein
VARKRARAKSGFGVEPHTGWWRLNHEGLALPLPSVYLPADDLYQRDLAALNFAPVLEVSSGGELPLSRHILANVEDPERLMLMVSRRELYQIGGGVVAIAEDQDTKAVTGCYSEPADRTWQREVQKARRIILVAGARPAAPGTTGVNSAQELLTSRESLFGLMFSPTTMMAMVVLSDQTYY